MTWHERFWAKVEKSENGCWLWTASTSEGYGQLEIEGCNHRAHVLSFKLHRGPVPEGQCVCHSCDVRRCIRPDHLFLGTRAENLADMRHKGRHAKGDLVANRGSANGNSKLTEKLVMKIRKRVEGGESQTSVARAFEVHQTLVSLIVRRKIWADYP